MAIRIIATIGAIAFLYFAKSFLIPIILSLCLFYLLDPLAVKAKTWNISRSVSIPIILLFSIGCVSGMGWVSVITTGQIADQLPNYSSKIKKVIEVAREKAKIVAYQTSELMPEGERAGKIQKVEVVKGYAQWTGVLLKGLDSFFGVIGVTSIIFLLSGLILYEKEHLVEKFSKLTTYQSQLSELNHSVSTLIQRFFLGNLLSGVGSSIAFFLIFWALGLDNKFALSMGAGFLNIIPILGTFLSIIFPFAQGMLQYNSATPFLMIFLGSLAIHFVFGNLILPKMIGKTLDLNTVAATFGLVFWGWLWGPIGVFLAVPLTAMLKILLNLKEETAPFALVLSQTTKSASPIILATSWKVAISQDKHPSRGIEIESL